MSELAIYSPFTAAQKRGKGGKKKVKEKKKKEKDVEVEKTQLEQQRGTITRDSGQKFRINLSLFQFSPLR